MVKYLNLQFNDEDMKLLQELKEDNSWVRFIMLLAEEYKKNKKDEGDSDGTIQKRDIRNSY